MTCEKLQEQFVEYFLGELSPDTQHAIDQHLHSGCEACNQEFHAIHDATELLFTIAPLVELTQSQRDAIYHNALSANWTANYAAVAPGQPAYRVEHRKRTDRGYGLLALVAGFVLVMLAPSAARRNSQGPSLAQQQPVHSLEGEQVKPNSKLKFVSFKDVSSEDTVWRDHHNKRQQLTGFLLVDAQAREIHLLGRIEQADAADVPRFELIIVTTSEKFAYSLKFDSQGSCRAIVPLPSEPILSIELRNQARESTEAVS